MSTRSLSSTASSVLWNLSRIAGPISSYVFCTILFLASLMCLVFGVLGDGRVELFVERFLSPALECIITDVTEERCEWYNGCSWRLNVQTFIVTDDNVLQPMPAVETWAMWGLVDMTRPKAIATVPPGARVPCSVAVYGHGALLWPSIGPLDFMSPLSPWYVVSLMLGVYALGYFSLSMYAYYRG